VTDTHPKLNSLITTVHQLRAPGGCAWDAEQTHESLVQYLTEETAELTEAIEVGTRDDLLEELGDVLYQVLFHADLAEDFGIEDVADYTNAKMIGRHPHVFNHEAHTADEVVARWDDLKKADKPDRTSVLDGIPQGMPSLALADKLVGRAHKVGEELEAVEAPEDEAALGRLLLGLVAGAKARGLDSERALRSTLRVLQDDIRSKEAGAEASVDLDADAEERID
jgi:XTP/dITP diphosphohydrolase